MDHFNQSLASDSTQTMRNRLQATTQAYHQQLNHHHLLVGITQADYSPINYQKLLYAYFQLYQTLESQIKRFTAEQPCAFNYLERIKLPWLLDDLAFLTTRTPAANQGNNLDMLTPEINSIGQLVGVLYVIEGSTLGGQIISRCLSKNFGYTANTGARFFYGYGEHSKAMWQEFIDFAQSIAADETENQAAVASACLTFQLFKQQLDQYHAKPLLEID